MGARLCKAVLDLRLSDFDGINNQGKLFLDHFFKETILYPHPYVSESDFRAQWIRSLEATAAAMGGSKLQRSIRNSESRKLHAMMSGKVLPYINSLYRGKREKIEKAGAKVSADPSPVPAPDQPIIKKIERGPEPNTIKVYLVRGINSKQKRRSRMIYRIYMYQHIDDIESKEIGSTYSSINLVGEDVPYDAYFYISVEAKNANGTSPLAEKVRFWMSTC
jgi:hypothetical protein